jgi:glycosyltransferase involved in cell wall biosynthesis
MSRSGEKALLDSGLHRDRVFYAPHSFNPSVFYPGASTMRAKMSIPEDAHLTMINAANKGNTPIRKCFPEMLLAWATFANRHPDAYLYLHTEVLGMAGGVRIERLLERFKAPLDRVRLVPQYELRMGIGAAVMGDLYRAADVLLSTSRGEGFGLGVLEAQATGIPAIATNWTAQPELVGSGWTVEGELEWDEFQGSFWKVPHTEEILNALESSYALKGDPAAAADERAKALAHAAPYATDRVFSDHWVPILSKMETLVREPSKIISLPANRAARRAGKK